MSNVLTTTNQETLQLLPRDVQIDPLFNVRPYSQSHSDAEDKLILQLAHTMETCGQLDNLLITPQRVLICGHRRRKAAIVINERRSVLGQSLFLLNCTVHETGGDLWQKAITSNLHRRESSVMDLAFLITQIRRKFSWIGSEGYTKVAEYLGIERSAVYQAERFLSAPGQIQNMLHLGYLSVQSALRLMRTVPREETPKAIELAQQYQEEDRLDKVLAKCEKDHKSPEEAAIMIRQPEPTRIEAPAVARAIRDITAARMPLSKGELVDGLRRQQQPDLSPAHHSYLDYLLNTFIPGQGNVRELRSRFASIGNPLSIPVKANGIFVHSPPN